MPELKRMRVLICDDDETFHLIVKKFLKTQYDCISAYNSDEALAVLKSKTVDILLLDVQMRTADEGLKFVPVARELDPSLLIVMSSAETDYRIVKEAIQLGASDYIGKDNDPEGISLALDRIIERQKLVRKKKQSDFENKTHHTEHLFIGESGPAQKLKRMIEKIRMSDANVLIVGETGTGKEIVARMIRKESEDGALEPFVAVDSATIQASTAESQLFGHEKGAFTGADKSNKGLFEEADGGVIYFDEIGNMPLNIQVKLLRAIQEKEIVRLGSTRAIQLDFRVVCATNRNLDEMVKKGEFKEDLLQRLSVLPVGVPTLRDRKDDIPLLIEHFLKRNHAPHGQVRFDEETVETLKNYNWPGNIRELGNLVAYLLTFSESDEITLADLPPHFRAMAEPEKFKKSGGFYDQVGRFEKTLLESALKEFEGNISKMALSLEMDRSHLYTKLKEYGLYQPQRS